MKMSYEINSHTIYLEVSDSDHFILDNILEKSKPNFSDMPLEEIIKFIKDIIEVNGFDAKIINIDGTLYV